jgi:HD-GYP domain-containing protein (c-di-GMP phosphodiesterase class II)
VLLLTRGECLDGSGRPLGLRGEQLPLGARILGVIDEFEGLTHGRAYRTALTVDEALAALREAAGSRFDAAVIDALAASLGDAGWTSDGREEAA